MTRLLILLGLGIVHLPGLHAQALEAGLYPLSSSPSACLTPAQRDQITRKLAIARDQLVSPEATYSSHRPARSTREPVKFIHPLRWSALASGCFANGVRTAHVDHNDLAGTLDYACGSRTYNGHQGTDFMPWPFPWWAMANDYAEVLCAADGVILYREDGHSDQHCDHPDSTWNAVYVQHEDGSTSWYGHLKRGSLTPKNVGDSVLRGEVLGIVGSSGFSNGPHLHFEVHDASDKMLDPFRGGCNDQNDHSLWLIQETYRKTRIQAIGLHTTVPSLAICAPEEGALPEWRERIYPDEKAYVGVYLKDQRVGQTMDVQVLDARGKRVATLTHTVSVSGNAGWVLFALDTKGSRIFGNWQVRVAFEDEIKERTFQYCFNEELCACPGPTMPYSNYIGSGRYGLYWDAVEEALVYQIQGGRADTIPTRFTVTGTNVDLHALEPESSYIWRVRAMCGSLPSFWSPWERLDVPGTEVAESPSDAIARTLPSHFTEPEITRVHDMTGRLCWQGVPSRIPWADLPSGWYWVKDGASGKVSTVWHQP